MFKKNKFLKFAAAKSLQSCLTLCNPIDGSPPGSSLPGILQARILEWVTIPSPMHESDSEVAQSCPTLSNPMDCSPPGSSVHRIFQARVLEWGAIVFSMANLDSILKSRDIILPTKVHLVKATVFPVFMYGYELDYNQS